jgi:hypothetical protein
MISEIAKNFLSEVGYKPRYINKNGYKCLAILTQEEPLYTAQSILNDLTTHNIEKVGLDLFRAFLLFKYEGFGLDSVIYWPTIAWEEVEA